MKCAILYYHISATHMLLFTWHAGVSTPPYTHKQTSTQACVLAHRRELTHTRLLVMTQHEPPDKFSNTISSTRRLTNGHLSLSVQPHCFCSTFPSSVNTGLKDAERKVDHTKQKRYT